MIGALLLSALVAGAGGATATPPADAPPPAAPAAAHPLSFAARASRAEVRLGEPFDYELEVRHRPEEWYALPAEPSLAPFRAHGGACRRAEQGGEVTTTCTLRLALFALGPVDVPALPLQVQTPAGPAVLGVPGPRVTGVGILDPAAPPESLALRDIAPPVPLLVRSLRRVGWALGLLAGVALAVLGWRELRRRRGIRSEPATPPPPHERLARLLDALEAERLGERGLAREHFFRLSEAVREYLGALLGVSALDLTTAELLGLLGRAGDPRLDPEALRGFLEDVDLVKFARAAAGPGECAAGVAFARRLLARTRPAEAAPPAGPGADAARERRVGS
ncbi:MAG TPA: hypothetical protein VML50_02010 [Anaeromyxobacter sp.]|nr:hypothetical protein [Anaeromyxobacter sp.]